MIYDRLDEWVLRGERRLGRAFWPAVGLAGMLLAAALVAPGLEPRGLGRSYAELAANPFAFDGRNPVGYRLLTPLLSYLVGLRGDAIIVTNWVIAGSLLAAVGAEFRRRAPRPADGLAASAVLTTSLVVLSTVHSGAYCDPLTYLLIFLMWRSPRGPGFFVWLFLALLNREAVAFLAPWLVYRAHRARDARTGLWLEQGLGYGLAFAAFFAVRAWISSQAPVPWDLAYYLEPLVEDPLRIFKKSLGSQWIGLFSVFQLLWAIPLVAAGTRWRDAGTRDLAVSMLLVVVCAWLQLFVAYDTSRMLTLAYPAMLLGLDALFRSDATSFRRWLPWLWLVNLVLPSVRVVGARVWSVHSTPWALVLDALGIR